MRSIFKRLHKNQYLNSKIVLGVDTCISFVASVLSVTIAMWLYYPSIEIDRSVLFYSFLISIAVSFVYIYALGTYRSIIRHSDIRSLARLGMVALLKVVTQSVLYVVIFDLKFTPIFACALIMDFLLTTMALVSERVVVVTAYNYLLKNERKDNDRKRVLVYGVHDKSVAVVTRLRNSSQYEVKGFLTYGSSHKQQTLVENPIYYFEDAKSMEHLQKTHRIDAVLFAWNVDVRSEKDRLINYCVENNILVLIAPDIEEVKEGGLGRSDVREIKIEDLLGREEIKISMDEIRENFFGKTVMVTGAAGSIGSELCRQMAVMGVKSLVLFDNAETPMHNIRLELEEKYPDISCIPVIGDVRQEARLDFVFRMHKPQIVFHAAAYKHVPLMEDNPCEAVLVNVCGTRYVTDKCLEYGVEKMVMISTDKAVNPTNIMGCTKRLAEIYVQSLGLALSTGEQAGNTKFVTTRFGNVLGSNGSVIPRFREQITKGGPITVTHKNITRFFMTIPEACRLVMEAATLPQDNKIFVFDMGESVRIEELAKRMIELSGLVPDKDIKIEYTGLRPGEKLYEEVLASAESTLPTSHNRIRIAQVREYDYKEICDVIDKLCVLSKNVEIIEMVRLMKQTVPEYHSENSKFKALDK